MLKLHSHATAQNCAENKSSERNLINIHESNLFVWRTNQLIFIRHDFIWSAIGLLTYCSGHCATSGNHLTFSLNIFFIIRNFQKQRFTRHLYLPVKIKAAGSVFELTFDLK